MDLVEMPENFDVKTFHTNMTPQTITGKDVLSVRELKIGYDKPLATISMEVKKGKKYAALVHAGGDTDGKI